MKKAFCSFLVYFCIQPFVSFLFAQDPGDSTEEREASGILSFLASDKLKGRANFSPELIKAGEFISKEFQACGLQPFPGNFNYHQSFNASTENDIFRDNVQWNGRTLDQSQFFYLSSEMLPPPRVLGDFKIVEYDGEFKDSLVIAHWIDTTNTLIWVKQKPLPNQEAIIGNFRHPGFPPSGCILLVVAADGPNSLSVTTKKDYRQNVLFNIIGVLPGKSTPNEIVIFSAHYDHIGRGASGGGEIYNGANDDASGTTALIMLARYFASRNDNERSIFFCAFAGEEIGLKGSEFLAALLKPEAVKAVINIEMIGKTNFAGKNSFFITGANYSSVEEIFKKNLIGSGTRISKEPVDGNLFQRSDNFPFAVTGIAAHSIMCSDDHDPCYHKPCDTFRGIDVANMARIIRAVAIATLSIVSGRDTPSRINTKRFR